MSSFVRCLDRTSHVQERAQAQKHRADPTSLLRAVSRREHPQMRQWSDYRQKLRDSKFWPNPHSFHWETGSILSAEASETVSSDSNSSTSLVMHQTP